MTRSDGATATYAYPKPEAGDGVTHHTQAVVPLPPREALKTALRMAGPLRGTAAAGVGLLAMHEASYVAHTLQQPQPTTNADSRLLVEADPLASLLAARDATCGELSAAAMTMLDETVAAGAMYVLEMVWSLLTLCVTWQKP
jgi:hypothetical protein